MTQQFNEQHPRSASGRFAAKDRPDPGSSVLSAGRGPAGHAALLELDADDLQRLVDGSPAEQMIAAKAVALTDKQAEQLADPSNPFAVRLMVATRSQPGVALRAAQDPDPLVRLRALQVGFDLPEEVRHALSADAAVRRAAVIFGQSAHVPQ